MLEEVNILIFGQTTVKNILHVLYLLLYNICNKTTKIHNGFLYEIKLIKVLSLI